LTRQFEQLLWIIKAILGSPAGSVNFLDLGGLPYERGSLPAENRYRSRHPAQTERVSMR
jgi:hypothetical protein